MCKNSSVTHEPQPHRHTRLKDTQRAGGRLTKTLHTSHVWLRQSPGVSTAVDGCRWTTSAKDLDNVPFFILRRARFLQAEQIRGPAVSSRVEFIRLVCDSSKEPQYLLLNDQIIFNLE